MAARFWVGGTGNWDASTTTNWSASSGGAGGAAVPTSSDDVTFDSNSGTSATVTITAAANANSITVNKSDLTLTHSAGSTVVGIVTLTTGTLNTNGQTCSWGSFSSTNSNTRTLTLGASAITLTLNNGTVWDTTTSTGLTFSANTSAITINGNSSTGTTATMNAGSLTYNSVIFAPTGTDQLVALNGSSPTFANFTVTGNGGTNANLTLGTSITVTTALTMTGASSSSARLFINSVTVGTPQTITNNGSGTFTNLDLQDIVGAGSASWNLLAITGGSGDCGGNSGITFSTPRTLFWVGNASSWGTANKWSLSSGGTANQSNPLAQDNLTFDSHSFSSTGQTVTLNIPRAGKNIDFTNVTNSPTLSLSPGASTLTRIYGSLTLVAGMSFTGNGSLWFEGRGNNTFTTAGIAFGSNLGIVLNAPGGTLNLSGDLICSSASSSFTVRAGTFTTVSSNITIGSTFSFAPNTSPPVAKTINMGSGTWTANGTGFVWNTNITNNTLTINAQTSTIVIANATSTLKTFSGNGFSYNVLTISGDNVLLSGNSTLNTLNINNAGLPTGLKLDRTATQTITNTVSTNASAGNLAILISSLAGSAAAISKSSGTIALDYMSIKDSTAIGGATWYAGAHSTNVSNNSGWIFESPPNWTSGWGIPI